MLIKVYDRLISLIFTIFYKLIYFNNLKLNVLKVSINGRLIISKGKLSFMGKFNSRKGIKINVVGGKVIIKDKVFFNHNVSINCHNYIEIGENTMFGENVLIYDHDHIRVNNILSSNEYISKPIIIGDNVWIGASTIILKGVNIGNNVTVASGSVITKDIPSNTTIIQKRQNIYLGV